MAFETGFTEPDLHVGAVVTAFRPTFRLVENVKSLLEQVSTVVVVDDGSGPGFDNIFHALTEAGAVLVHLDNNAGIAAALNAGIARAREMPEVRFVLTVDQDSLLPDGYVGKLCAAYEAAEIAGVTPGLVSPQRIHGNPVKRAGIKSGILLGREPIQSGLLIPTATLDAIGDFWDGLFIDLVDTEYFLRASDAGLPTVLADTEFKHSLGTMVEAGAFGRTFKLGRRTLSIRIAASWRYYYIFRNRILVGRRYGRKHPAWVASSAFLDLRHLLIVSLFAPGRSPRLKSAFRGMLDGMLGRSGKAHNN
jgi:rhamnosyltransferase